MSETIEARHPDPTLTACGDEYVMLQPSPDDNSYPLEIAHRSSFRDLADAERARCGWTFPGTETWLPARNAAWFAVPCRECFPDAPEPGTRHSYTFKGHKVVTPVVTTDCFLAWQVPS
jgi:hypothetical protein